MARSAKQALTDEDIRSCFQYFDSNGDDFISPKEMMVAFARQGSDLTPEELNDVFEEYDQDRDGLIEYNGESQF